MRSRDLLCCVLLGAVAWPGGGVVAGGVEAGRTASIPSELDDAVKERFLLEGEILRSKDASGGITPSRQATLRLEGLEHDAHIQSVDESKAMAVLADGPPEIDFRDSYLGNVAAYRLDRLLGLHMVPVTVVRSYRRKPAAFTWWVDDVVMDERERSSKKIQPPHIDSWNRQIIVVRIFDQLIYNTDRNPGNLLIDEDWRVWMIDHTRAFKVLEELQVETALGVRCPRSLFAALRKLDEPLLRERMGDVLSQGQLDGLLARRDRIVAYYDAKIEQFGEATVLYDLPDREAASPPAAP